MTNKFLQGVACFSTCVTVGLLSTLPASALSFGFQNIFPATPSEQAGDAFVGNFSVDVTQSSNNTVLFTFFNSAPSNTTRFIRQVFFDAPSNLLSGQINNVGNIGTVNFVSDVSNFSQGNKLIPSFETNFGADRVQGQGNAFGVQGGEALGIQFTSNYNSVIGAIQNGSLRLGIHVQALDGDASDSFVNTSTAVPTPALLPGLVAMGIGVLRKRKAEAIETSVER